MGTIISKKTYSYSDLTIVPCMTEIDSRSECNPFTEESGFTRLPLFTAPMDCVVNEENFEMWEMNHITPILPRTIKYETRFDYMMCGKWIAVSLSEFKQMFLNETWHKSSDAIVLHICIDIANGHMKHMYDEIEVIKQTMLSKYNVSLVIMIGNIANPQSYHYIAWQYNDVIDYVRLSIGSGNGCITTPNTGVHYPIASLVNASAHERDSLKYQYQQTEAKFPKIIADGGIRNYGDAIKALALGADYVMVGSLFSSFLESAAELSVNYNWKDKTEEQKRDFLDTRIQPIYKEFYGMSTKKAQAKIIANSKDSDTDAKQLKTSEGCIKQLECKYTMKQWVDNFISYIRSAMSYTNCRNLWQFKTNVELIENSPNEIMSTNK